jgi:hypothetical protein
MAATVAAIAATSRVMAIDPRQAQGRGARLRAYVPDDRAAAVTWGVSHGWLRLGNGPIWLIANLPTVRHGGRCSSGAMVSRETFAGTLPARSM